MNKKYINVGGRQLPFRVTMGAMLRFKQQTGHDVRELRGEDISDAVTFLWCCVVSASKADGITDIPSLEEFADLLEPADMEAFYGTMTMSAGEVKKTTPPAGTATTEA